MSEFWKRLGAPLAVAGLVFVAIFAILWDRAEPRRDLPGWQGVALDLAASTGYVLSTPVRAVQGWWDQYVDLVGVRTENRQLTDRVAVLEAQILNAREALVASGHLDRIAEMQAVDEVPHLPAQVVAFDVAPSFRSILLDQGRHDGVRPGHPVLVQEGLVGLLTAVSGGASRTMLLLDRQSAVSAVVQRSRVRGLVRGRGTEALEFEFEARGSDVQSGDIIVTSGLGGVYPKGLRIGRVEDVADARGHLLATASVHPAVDFGNLEHVSVLLRRAPSMALLHGDPDPQGPDNAQASR